MTYTSSALSTITRSIQKKKLHARVAYNTEGGALGYSTNNIKLENIVCNHSIILFTVYLLVYTHHNSASVEAGLITAGKRVSCTKVTKHTTPLHRQQYVGTAQ